jgi:hypothetical protein
MSFSEVPYVVSNCQVNDGWTFRTYDSDTKNFKRIVDCIF